MKLNKTERKSFFDYVKLFYGKNFTDKEINVGVDEYLEIVTKSYWCHGDTADRENVLIIMLSNRHTKIEKEIKKLKKELEKYPKIKEKTIKGILDAYKTF
jgi:hypothetical protein